MRTSRWGRWWAALGAALIGPGCGQGEAIRPAARGAAEVAPLFWFMVIAGSVVFVLVVVVLAASVRGGPVGDERRGQRLILAGGVLLPLVILVPLSVWTYVVAARVTSTGGPDDARAAAPGSLVVEIVGHRFWWEIRYPHTGAVTANELHLPANTKVTLRMRSDDVIHSFWVPSLHGKVDLIPGETTQLVIEDAEAGTYRGFCAEYCGLQHAGMRMVAHVQERSTFQAWLDSQSRLAAAPSTEEARTGAEVFQRSGCASCHTVRGTAAAGQVGPDLTHVASRGTLAAGVIPNNRGRLAGWLLDPQSAKPGALMPPTALDAAELHALLAYLEGLR